MKKVIYGLSFTALILASCGGDHSNESNTEANTDATEVAVNSTTEEVEINGVKHFIEKIGEGEPIVVLHGGPGIFHDYLVPHFKQLAQEYQIIFYDQRGCGRTDFPKDTTSIKAETFVEDLEAIRNHLKIEKMNLLGHSWGSLLAMKYGMKYPSNLNKLILVSPAPANSDFFDQTFANMQKKRSEDDTKELIQSMMSKKFETREEETFRKVILLGDKTNLVDQSKIEELYAPIQFSPTTANNLLIVNSLLERTYFNFDITNEGLENITCPTIILLGDMDNVPFVSAQSIQDKIPGCQLTVFKNSCHYPFFEVPGEFNMAVKNFLNPDYEQ